MLAAVRFGHRLLRHQPVLAHDIRNPGKLAAVAERVLEQPLDRPILARCVAGVDNPLQEEVRLLQLIPEKTVVLRKLKGPQPVARNHAGAQHVQTREEPATARLLLVGDAFRRYPMREIGVDFALIRLVDDQLANIVVADRIAQRAVGRRILVGGTYPLQHPVADPAVVLRPEGQQGRYGEGPDKYDSFHNSVSIRFLRTEVIQTVLGSTKIVQAEGKNKPVCILPRRSLSKRRLVLRKVCKPRADPNLFGICRGAAYPSGRLSSLRTERRRRSTATATLPDR